MFKKSKESYGEGLRRIRNITFQKRKAFREFDKHAPQGTTQEESSRLLIMLSHGKHRELHPSCSLCLDNWFQCRFKSYSYYSPKR